MYKPSLTHYGTPRHSGRYPWGSGDDPEQRNKSFMGQVHDMKKKGMTDKQIADGLGLTIKELRAKKSIAKNEIRKADEAQAWKLKEKGYSNMEIGRRMNRNESSIRALLDPGIKQRTELTDVAVNMLKDSVDSSKYIDVGVGVERHMGISRTRLQTAIQKLKEEGYTVHYIKVEQLGTGKQTSVMVLAKPETKYGEVYKNKDKIRMPNGYSEDKGHSFSPIKEPVNIDSARIHIRYGDKGGSDKDGVIELRRGVEDLSLGKSKYAQVRVAVDGTHYMKGMAMYSDDIPKGFDIVYNTNKKSGTPPERVFKEMKSDPENPFGAIIRQKNYIGSDGKEHLSPLNIVGSKEGAGEEGSWDDWAKTLSSQMLSKQSPALAKKQLGLAYDEKQKEYDEIMSLTNPAVKKRLLDAFADDCDSSAVHLKAAAMPRQGAHVILPLPNMKENEIYAPNYRNGESVVLIRYPHGGTFEIPELKVNNKDEAGRRLLGQSKDAVGINPKVAERLSGADFDGDSVLVIPNNNKAIKTTSRLKDLIDFDPKVAYPPYDGMQTIDAGIWNEKENKVIYGKKGAIARNKQVQMGGVSNLITDMTIKGANTDEIARAVRHSMVVIDSEKHHLDYRRSYLDNNIGALKKKYQGKEIAGASTLISRASSQKRVNYREEGKKIFNPETGRTKRVYIDPTTGKKLYEYTGETYTDKKGKVHIKTIESTKMAEVDDAFELSSGTRMEAIYANHANKLKALGNQSRKDLLTIQPTPYSASAKKVYQQEVSSLQSKLNIALKNAPLERQAQILANSIVASKKANNPDMSVEDLKKEKARQLAEARVRMGAKKDRIEITEREWEAIQAGAISTNTLTQILNNTDLDKIKELATPRTRSALPNSTQSRAKAMLASGRTQSEIADALGVSVKTVAKLIE